jgi:hypothetical protein
VARRPGTAVAADVGVNASTEIAMNTNSSSHGKPDAPSPDARRGQPVQTGALPGGQPGQGVNTSSSPTGQSNVDATARQGVEYGKNDRPPR